MAERIIARPLTAAAFAPYGDVIEKDGAHHFPINNGKCMRYHDLAKVETSGPGAHPIVSIASSEPYELPLSLTMVERHPFGSQAFIPLTDRPYLVVVCPDENGTPRRPEAFLAANGQGVNYRQNTWHGVLTPLEAQSDFIIVDRAGEGENLEEFFFDAPYSVVVE